MKYIEKLTAAIDLSHVRPQPIPMASNADFTSVKDDNDHLNASK